MPRTRSLEVWHIPKRQNVHQIVGAVEILSQNTFNGKSWTSMRKEAFNSQLGRNGLTERGKPLSPSARRTLEALLKYLGFVFVDTSTMPETIYVTNAGMELIKKHGSILGRCKNLRQAKENNEEILESPLVKHQMSKLQITNPVIKEDCINILLFPFRITLRLLLDLGELTKEELGYIVFSMRKEDEYNLILERIKTFRSLQAQRRVAEIEAFKGTEIGNLTLVQAPTTAYYMGLCVGTGLCDRSGNKLFIKEGKSEEVKTLLGRFKGVRPFNFGDNLRLWIDYYGNVERLQPPILVRVIFKNTIHVYIRILNSDGEEVEHGVISEERMELFLPLFRGEKYKFEFYSFLDAKKINEQEAKITAENIVFDIPIQKESRVVWDIESIIERIKQLIVSHDFDPEYKHHINIVKTVTGKTSFNVAQLRGGRLEYLFYRLLSLLKERGIINDVVWNGRLDEFGLAYPALGGKEGYPDIYFFADNTLFILELTTIRAGALQWSAEGASVHDHIMNQLKKVGGSYKVAGLFSAPTLAPRITSMFAHISSKEKIPHIPIPINDLVGILKNGKLDQLFP